jgi:hypothetical protein
MTLSTDLALSRILDDGDGDLDLSDSDWLCFRDSDDLEGCIGDVGAELMALELLSKELGLEIDKVSPAPASLLVADLERFRFPKEEGATWLSLLS